MKVLCLPAAFLMAGFVAAAPPVCDYVFPAGGKVGETFNVTVGGKLGTWPVQVWASKPGVEFKPKDTNGQYTVTISTNATVGPCLVRFYSAEGASKPRIFVVGLLPEENEREPKDSRDPASTVALPRVMNGQFDKGGDMDLFAVELHRGKTFVAMVEAYVLGSPLDCHLHLVDAQGVRVAFSHDGATLDSLLTFEPPQDGRHTLQLAAFAHPPQADVRFYGKADAVYRLTLTEGPFVRYTFPAGGRRGETGTMELCGWNLDSGNKVEITDLGTNALPWIDRTELTVPVPAHHQEIAQGEFPEIQERENNNRAPQGISLPVLINGHIQPAGDEDAFSFPVKKGEKLEFEVESARLNFPLDATLKIETTKGDELARDDDTGGQDAKVVWTAREDGTFVVRLGDLFDEGGTDFVYRLRVGPPLPDFSVKLPEHALRVEPGKSAELKLSVKRENDHTNELAVQINNLPEGITMMAEAVPVKSGETKVTFTAAATAIPTNVPVEVRVVEKEGAVPKTRWALYDLQGEESRGNLLINACPSLWITVPPVTEEKVAKTETKSKP